MAFTTQSGGTSMIPLPSSRNLLRKILGGILFLSVFIMLGGCGDDQTQGPAEQAGGKIDATMKETGESMKDAMGKTSSAVHEAAESAVQAVNEAAEEAQQKMEEMGEAVKETAQEAVQNTEKAMEESTK